MRELNEKIDCLREDFDKLCLRREMLLTRIDKLNVEKEQTIHNIDLRLETIRFVEAIAEHERSAVKERVERLITTCLQSVYDDSYSVEFDYGVRNNRTSVEINVIRKCDDGMVIRRTIDGIGGGVADTVALPLKLIVLMNDNEFDKVLIVDEPGKHLDTTRVVYFAEFLQNIAEKLNMQIIMSSHHDCMRDYADNIHEVTIHDSISKVTKLK